LDVREGEAVQAGARVALISAEEVERQLDQAQSRVSAAEAQLRMRDAETQAEMVETDARLRGARERLQQVQERVSTLEHHLDKVRADHRRNQELLGEGFISERQLANSENALRQAQGDLAEARHAMAAARSDVRGAEAAAQGVQRQRPELLESLQQQASAARAARGEVDISHHEMRVVAPVSGTVITRTAEVGELVARGAPIVVLADLTQPYLRIYLPERDAGKVKLNASARVYVDAFSERAFDAVVSEVGAKAEFTPKDVHMPDERTTLVYSVKLALTNPESLLKPGMPATAYVRWKSEASWPATPRP
jgi:HlyD family secretion protein